MKLNEEGEVIGTTSYLEWGEKGKKPLPEIKTLPEPVKRSSGVNPNFLCDNASYLLGVDQKGKPERAKKCFEAAKALHQKILAGVDSLPPRLCWPILNIGTRTPLCPIRKSSKIPILLLEET